MSGAEALLVIGIIANIIQLVDFSTKVIERIEGFSQDVINLPESFRNLQIELPLLANTLKRTNKRADSGELDEDTCKAIKPIVAACEEKLKALNDVFARVVPKDGASKAAVVWKAILSLKKEKEVEQVSAAMAGFVRTLTLHYAEAAGLTQAERTLIADAISRLRVDQDVTPDMSWFTLDRVVEAELHARRSEHKAVQCLEGTRVELLSDITSWTEDRAASCIFWLSGVAGSGKSTVARTIATQFYQKGQLGAAYFFSRDEERASRAGSIVSTMAFQLTQQFPAVGHYIRKAIEKEPNMATMSLKHQWEKLIISPIRESRNSKLDSSTISTMLFVIDALDECQDKDDVILIPALLAMAQSLHDGQLRILVTCRQESYIDRSFRRIPKESKQHIVLHEVNREHVDHDIHLFLKHELSDRLDLAILSTDIDRIVEAAAGLFIFAATVCRYIEKGRLRARKRLSEILGNLSSRFLSPLDQLYNQALKDSISMNDDQDEDEKEEIVGLFRKLAGAMVTLANPLTISAISQLLEVPLDEARDMLESLRAVLNVPKDDRRAVRVFHKSFHDFLLDEKRCTDVRFHIREEELHTLLAERCLSVMEKNLKRDICGLRKPGILIEDIKQADTSCLPEELRYACQNWVYHLRKSKACIPDDGFVHQVLRHHFLHWLEAMSLMQSMPGAVLMVATLLGLVTVRTRSPIESQAYQTLGKAVTAASRSNL
jgi:hypothetical protein